MEHVSDEAIDFLWRPREDLDRGLDVHRSACHQTQKPASEIVAFCVTCHLQYLAFKRSLLSLRLPLNSGSDRGRRAIVTLAAEEENPG